MVVSLEAILLTAFVQMSHNHLTSLADRREILIFKRPLWAKRDLTGILTVDVLISERIAVDVRQTQGKQDFPL